MPRRSASNASALCRRYAASARTLDREELVNIIGQRALANRPTVIPLSHKGIERVHQALERSQYIGPAPVPLERYNAMIRAQAVGEVLLDEAAVQAAFEGLVVSPAMFDKIGPALNSGQSVFLYGPPGNGKTTIATRMARLSGPRPDLHPLRRLGRWPHHQSLRRIQPHAGGRGLRSDRKHREAS